MAAKDSVARVESFFGAYTFRVAFFSFLVSSAPVMHSHAAPSALQGWWVE